MNARYPRSTTSISSKRMRNGTDRQSLDISAKRASCTRVPHYPDRDARTSDATSEAVDSVGTLDLKVIEAFFWHSSCSDQGEAPFGGQNVTGVRHHLP